MKIRNVFLAPLFELIMDSMSLEEQFSQILKHFPNSIRINEKKMEIPLFPKASVTINCKKYPKKPKISLPKNVDKVIGDYESLIPLLRNWDKKNPPSLRDILYYIQAATETITGHDVHISDKIVRDICYIARSASPHEMFCLIRIINGILHEYIMAPGMEASEVSAVFFPGRFNQDPSIIASCHSHPTGNNRPSAADLQTFKKKPVNIIIGHPYNASTIAVYNRFGKRIPFQINSVDFEEDENGKDTFL